jgi:hypothetical protein
MIEELKKQFEIQFDKLNKYYPLYRHFEVVEHENITSLNNGAYYVKAKYYGVNGQKKTLPNLVVNKLIHNEFSFNLKRTPVYCRYDYSSGACSQSHNPYFQVIPVGNFNLYQSDIIKDIGQDLYMDLRNINSRLFLYSTVYEIDNDIVSLINKYVNSYKIENHEYKTNEILLDCESYLLIPIYNSFTYGNEYVK